MWFGRCRGAWNLPTLLQVAEGSGPFSVLQIMSAHPVERWMQLATVLESLDTNALDELVKGITFTDVPVDIIRNDYII